MNGSALALSRLAWVGRFQTNSGMIAIHLKKRIVMKDFLSVAFYTHAEMWTDGIENGKSNHKFCIVFPSVHSGRHNPDL